MNKRILFLTILAAALCSCSVEEGSVADVIPAPLSVGLSEGTFSHKPWSGIDYKEDSSLAPESYRLEVGSEGVLITSSDEAGRFYARQTLAMAAGVTEAKLDRSFWKVGFCTVEDSPRFPYRGIMIDVSRHFLGKDFIFRHLDAMAALKLNRLHLHLVDSEGWRFPCESRPELNRVGAYRDKEPVFGGWTHCEPGTKGAYGGFFTKKDIKAIVEYAEARHITVIPEIEMPGHSAEVLAACPELRCDSPVQSGDLCPGKEETFELLFSVLDEVMELFPSEYIHIGGDEVTHKSWADCSDCRRRMEEEGFDSPKQLQGYLLRRVEEYVRAKGRKVIGWDEILGDSLSTEAVVMSWRGVEPGLEAAASGRKAIMTPGTFCYFDTAQDFPEKERPTFGNYLPINKVYSFDPAEGVSDPSLILGVQANLWTELVDSGDYAEYLLWPRGFALAEVAWSQPSVKDNDDFRRRASAYAKVMQDRGYGVFDLDSELGERLEAVSPQEHLAKGAKVYMSDGVKWSQSYAAGGEGALTDGLCGGWTYKDGKWQGFLCDVCFMIDLEEAKPISSISLMSMQNRVHGIYLPESLEISLSYDGSMFEQVGVFRPKSDTEEIGAKFYNYSISCGEPTPVRYIVINAKRGPKGGFIFFDEVIVR
ncbi:MAG: beta-N-acetylhexosaminidase [Candidatus Cryptobacteroides sp.]